MRGTNTHVNGAASYFVAVARQNLEALRNFRAVLTIGIIFLLNRFLSNLLLLQRAAACFGGSTRRNAGPDSIRVHSLLIPVLVILHFEAHDTEQPAPEREHSRSTAATANPFESTEKCRKHNPHPAFSAYV